MSVHDRWRWGAGAFVLLAFALVSGSHLCGVALDEASDPGMKPIGSGGLACAEFWLNRYQTLFSALIAGSIAFWAGKLLLKQVSSQKVEYFSKLIRDVRDIYDLATELYGICNGPLSPNLTIRLHGERSESDSFATFLEIKADAYNAAIQDARERMIRLEVVARRTSGPSVTADRAQSMAMAVAEFLRVSQFDAIPSGNWGVIMPNMTILPTQKRNPDSKKALEALSYSWRKLFEDGQAELADLARRQTIAHEMVR